MKVLEISLKCAFGFALLFSVFSLIFTFGDWKRLGLIFSLGFFIGLLTAPEFEPKLFKKVWLYQSCCGLVAGLLVGLTFHFQTEGVLASTLIGGILGYFAPIWINHI